MKNLQVEWLKVIRALTGNLESAEYYLDRRLQFTTAIGRLLSKEIPSPDGLVYGVWLDGHQTPIYIGQTLKGRRRLWDLPIGESHHLANSFPPEIWARVVVVFWEKMLNADSLLLKKVCEIIGSDDKEKNRSAIGLGLEYLLQRRYQPLFNCRKKKRDGSWRKVDWSNSNGLGAKVSPILSELFYQMIFVWENWSEKLSRLIFQLSWSLGELFFHFHCRVHPYLGRVY